MSLADARLQTLVWSSNLARSEQFYSDVLGLPLAGRSHGALVYRVGQGSLRVSPVQSTTSSEHTVVGFEIEEFDRAVAELTSMGVTFERFPGRSRRGWSLGGAGWNESRLVSRPRRQPDLAGSVRRLDVFDQTTVKLRSAVAEETESGAVLLRLGKIESRDQHASLFGSEFRQHVSALVADEAVTVEALAMLGADSVGGDHGDDIRNRVTDHRSPPQA